MRVLYWMTIAAVLMGVVSCTSKDEKEEPFYIGIWQGKLDDRSFSMEFREDGRLVSISSQDDEISIFSYCIDLQKQPPHLEVESHIRRGDAIKTLIEQTGPNTIRIERETDGARPSTFTNKAFSLERVESHVLQRGAESAEERDKAIEHALTMDIIVFGGEQQEGLFAICEAVFRYMFEHNASAAQQDAAAYFLSIDQRDPPAEFMHRFAGHSPPVKPDSQFHEGNRLKFRVDSIVRLDEVTVEVEGGYYEGGESASGNTYVLRRQKGIWIVIKKKPGWIS